MQYILTEEEYNNLTNKQEAEMQIAMRDKALAWARKQLKPKYCGEGYCDTCTISDIGFYCEDDGDTIIEKVEGVNAPTRNVSKMVCKLTRNYSK
jgi:hypothetical protein